MPKAMILVAKPELSDPLYGSSILVDQSQLMLKYLKDIGIDAKLDQKEYGAYFATCFQGKFDSMAFGPQWRRHGYPAARKAFPVTGPCSFDVRSATAASRRACSLG